ncbi:MAG: SAM-dependent chlorinase/fluorinase [Halobacteria archaeon]
MAGLPITLLTDFGSTYTAAMKGRILSAAPDARIVEISTKIPSHSVREGAFLLRSVVRHFPPAVHVGVVDPGVGTRRKGLIVKAGGAYLVGPDNGLLMPAARALGKPEPFEITKEFPGVSRTFHGRDLFAPVAARLSRGETPDEFGVPLGNPVDLDLDACEVSADLLTGEVLSVDGFGNVVTNIPAGAVAPHIRPGDRLGLHGKIVPFAATYGEVDVHRPLVLVGSHDTVEIAVNQGSAAETFRLKAGDRVQLKVVR